jgi:hypothetical protein
MKRWPLHTRDAAKLARRRRDPAARKLAAEALDAAAQPPTPRYRRNPPARFTTNPAAWAVQEPTLPAPCAVTAAGRIQPP